MAQNDGGKKISHLQLADCGLPTDLPSHLDDESYDKTYSRSLLVKSQIRSQAEEEPTFVRGFHLDRPLELKVSILDSGWTNIAGLRYCARGL